MAKEKRPSPQKRPQRGPSLFLSMSQTTRDVLCISLLYVITLVLFRGIVFENGAFSSGGDTAAAHGYEKAGAHLEQTEGVDVVWMPYIFSGMPTFGSLAYGSHTVNYLQTAIVSVLRFLFLNTTWSWMVVHYFMGGVFMFLLLRTWKYSQPASLLAALAFMLSPFAVGLAPEGHGSKLMALSYLPMVVLLIHLLVERRDLLSFGLFAAGTGTLLLTSHIQMVYYTFMVVGLYLLDDIIRDFKHNTRRAVTKTVLSLTAMLLGFCIASYVYLSVYEYAEYSIRGGGASGGLTWDYATNWSWNPWELLTLLVPSFFGFQSPYYWGTMPFSSNSSVYVGVIPIILSIIALAYQRDRRVNFFAAVTVVVFLLSFGKHFALLYDLLFTYLPFFNRFRAPSMILLLLPFTMGVLAAHGFTVTLNLQPQGDEAKAYGLKRALLYGIGLLGILLLLGALFKPSLFKAFAGFMFTKEGELELYKQQYGQQAIQIVAQLKQVRFDMLWKDYVKFVLIAGASAGAILLFLQRKISSGLFAVAVISILIIDLLIIDTQYIDPKPAASEQPFPPDATTRFVKDQKGLFRIFPVGQLFTDHANNGTYLYHTIQSIGGYSPAKLKIYQTMIDSCLYRGHDPSFPLNMNIVNMLNAKYLLAAGQLPADRFRLVNVDESKRILTYENPGCLPRAFFVDTIWVAQDDQEVFRMLNSPESTFVDITEFKSTQIVLQTYASSSALLVLSEVYYPAGWKAFVDGNEEPILKTNYVLRSVVVPAGRHQVTFKFEPAVYRIGWTITHAAWGVSILCILVGLWRAPAFLSRFRRSTERKHQ
jgi:hypothetical protein